MAEESAVTRIRAGVYRVIDSSGRSEVVYVAGSSDDRWVFWNGHVFAEISADARPESSAARAEPALTR